MKNNPTPAPRLTCRLARGAIAIFGDTTAGEPRGPGSAHANACADCREYFAACDSLESSLRRDATRDWHEAPAGLEQNILRAVRQAAPAPRRTRPVWLALAGAAACALAAVVFFQDGFSPARPPVTDVKPAEVVVAVSPQQIWNNLKPSANAVLAADPLQKEAAAVAADARTALNFLAQNFLPTAPDHPASG